MATPQSLPAALDEQQDKTYDLEKHTASRDTSSTPSRCASLREQGEKTIVSFEIGDPANPYNWPQSKKLYVVITAMIMVMNSTTGSSIASGSTEATAKYFGVTSQAQLVLPVSIYLIGYVLGPLVFAPLSESYGRKPLMISTFIVFTAFTLGCALAPSFPALVVFRLLVGLGASTPMSVCGGIFADVYNTRKARGLVITIFMAATTWGPVIGPVASGFSATVSWRWSYWILLTLAGCTWPLAIFMPETYGPVILKRKAKRLRKERNDPNILAPSELEKSDLRHVIVVVLTRPIRMFFTEAIVLTSCLYLSVIYGIFYMFFQSYSIVYQGIYGFSEGEVGLTFLPIGVGAVLAAVVYLAWDGFYERSLSKIPAPAWTEIEEYVRLPLACFGGPLFAGSLFWLGWAARPDVHWIVPTLSALPFGIGFLLIFMGELNYVVDSYEIFAASAMGAASCSRSIFGVVLPFAARPMYRKLGVAWACSLLGFVSFALALIPFVFIRYGDRIRANSKFCQELRREKEEREAKEMMQREARLSDSVLVAAPEKQV